MTQTGGPAEVARVLAAAAAPAGNGPLAGEEAALAAFRAARLDPAAASPARSMVKSARARLLTLRVAVAALATTSVLGGVAFAASTQTLPYQRNDKPPVSAAPSPPPASDPPASPRSSPGGDRTPAPGNAPNARPAEPSPSLVGLCRAYTARPPGKRGKALETPAFDALVTAAGDRKRVAEYCATLLGESGKPEKPKKSPKPGKPGKPRTT